MMAAVDHDVTTVDRQVEPDRPQKAALPMVSGTIDRDPAAMQVAGIPIQIGHLPANFLRYRIEGGDAAKDDFQGYQHDPRMACPNLRKVR
jgi:hypothetical protein